MALELLTGPSLLILDEPTSGLDPALDLQVMTMLRRLANAGRVVLVVTHSLSYLDVCDQVLLLAPGGKTAYCGPARGDRHRLGQHELGPICSATVVADPDAAHREFAARCRARVAPTARVSRPRPAVLVVCRRPRVGCLHQMCTVARRQVRLIAADRGYFLLVALLPFVLGALALSGARPMSVWGPPTRACEGA